MATQVGSQQVALPNSLLIIVLDCNPWTWGTLSKADGSDPQGTGELQFAQLFDHLLLFISSFSMLNRKNKVALLASLPSQKCEPPACPSSIACVCVY